MISQADHEARGIAEIVSKGRPQRCARRNRIARAIKSGAASVNARLQTCDAASSARMKNLGLGVAKPGREIRKSSRSWEWLVPLSTDYKKRDPFASSIGPSARLAPSNRPFAEGGGVNIG